MQKSWIPISWQQVSLLTGAFIGPLAISLFLAAALPNKKTGSDMAVFAIVGALMALATYAIGAIITRRSLSCGNRALLVQHSLYTMEVPIEDITDLKVYEVPTVYLLGLETRKNGIAAFGYLSGWFVGRYGDVTFCAISSGPIYLINLRGNLPCKRIAISMSPESAEHITAWWRTMSRSRQRQAA